MNLQDAHLQVVQKLLIRQVPGRLGIAGDKLAYVGAGRHAHAGGCPRWPQLCGALRCTTPVYRGVCSPQEEMGWLSLPLHAYISCLDSTVF